MAAGRVSVLAAAATLPTVSITATSASKAEGSGGTTPFTFTVTRDSNVGTSSVNWAVVHGTTNATDFSGALSGTVSFAAGETSKVVTVNVLGDTTVEASETFSVALSSPVGATLGTSASAIGTITNDDLPTLSIVATSASKAEGNSGTTPFTFTVTRSSNVGTSSANWALINGTTTTADFSGAVSGVVSFAAGETSKVITLNVIGDTAIEANETFSIALSAPVGATLSATSSAAGNITNDDIATLSIAATSASQAEGNSGTTAFTFTVTRSSNVGTSSANWNVINGTTSSTDFSGVTAGVVSFAAGETSKVITVNVIGDITVEANETFSVALSSPISAVLGPAASATSTITNDDLPTLSIVATSASKAEGNSGTTPFTFTVTRSSNVGTSSANWAVVNGTATAADFSGATTGVVSFAAGETSKLITVNVLGDTAIEANETFSVALSAPVNATLSASSSALGTITNDDLPTLSIAATSASKAEGSSGTTPFTFTVTRSANVGTSSVSWAIVNGTTSLTDFSGATTGVVSFAAGETSKVITVNVIGDTAVEANETFSVALSSPVGATLGATASAMGTINNDDQPTLSIAASSANKSEGNSGTTPFTFTVTRNSGLGTSSVNWALTNGTTTAADFSGALSGSLTFAAGETSKVITVNVIGDTDIEANETFSVNLSAAVGATLGTSSATGTVINDDSRAGIDRSIATYTYVSVPATVDDSIDNLVSGSKWGGALATPVSLTYSFSTASSVFSYADAPGHTAFTSTQQAAAIRAMSAVSAICNVSFTQVSDTSNSAGDIRWTRSTATTDTNTSYAYYPSSASAGGDIWIGSGTVYDNPTEGNGAYAVFIHELGHALGLEHPHAGSPAPEPGEDQYKYSVMSYRPYDGSPLYGAAGGYLPTTYMLNDILALQYLYGVNTTSNAGDTVYKWTAGSSVYQCIWDVGGNDTIDASTQTVACSLNLNGGTFSTIGQPYWNTQSNVNTSLGIAYEVTGVAGVNNVIENAIGSAQADTLIGNAYNNVLTGKGGADTLTGGAGADTFRFETVTDGGDTLTDFTSGTDKIQVVSPNFAALPVGALASNRFVSGTAPMALDGNAVFLYNTSTGTLSFDSNGTAAGGLTVLATLSTGYRTLVAGDIQVVAS